MSRLFCKSLYWLESAEAGKRLIDFQNMQPAESTFPKQA